MTQVRRAELWRGTEPAVHLALVDSALDDNDAEHIAIRAEIRDGFRKCEEDNEALRKLLVGLLIALVTTSITIVATVLITGAPS